MERTPGQWASDFWTFVTERDASTARNGKTLAVLTALAIYKHKSNIQRLIAGTEHRFGEKAPVASAAPPPSP